MKGREVAISRMMAALLTIALVIVAAAGIYFYESSGSPQSQGSGPAELQVSIVETDPMNQIDSFVPQNVTAAGGTNVTLVIRNGDDEPRVFSLPAFAINQTISAGTTSRIHFVASQVGTFKYTSYATVVLFKKIAAPLVGYITVTP